MAIDGSVTEFPGQRADKRVGLPERVASELGRRIVSGAIAQGNALPTEPAIQQEFGVSRTAVREAVRLLSAKGLVEARPKTGTRVRAANAWNLLDSEVLGWHLAAKPSQQFIEDLFEMRLIFEPAAVEIAAKRAEPAMLLRMQVAMEAMASEPRGSLAQVEADLAFHMIILEASQNRMLRSLGSLIASALSVTFQLNWRSRSTSHVERVEMHRTVLKHILAGKSKLAGQAMERLILSSRDDSLAAVARAPAKAKVFV
jgi:GntR family galactonate operon transcriptional repressor